MSGADPLIRTERVSKVYNPRRPDAVRAVDDVSLEIPRGDVVVLQGPSGSGKTSLLSLVGCMSRPTSGRVHVAGDDVTRLSEQALTEVRRRRFGCLRVLEHRRLLHRGQARGRWWGRSAAGPVLEHRLGLGDGAPLEVHAVSARQGAHQAVAHLGGDASDTRGNQPQHQ